MLTKNQLTTITDYIAGSCQMGGAYAAAEKVAGREITEKEREQIEFTFEAAEMFECDQCGWWSHPGEGLGPICDGCKEENENDE
jgi:hypothetical protein